MCLGHLKNEIAKCPRNTVYVRDYYLAAGLCGHYDEPVPTARAYALEALFKSHEKNIYPHDLIAGSIRGMFSDKINTDSCLHAASIVSSYGQNDFMTNFDHFAPDYETLLKTGVGGILSQITKSRTACANEPDYEKKKVFLDAAEISMKAFSSMIAQYTDKAEQMAKETKSSKDRQRFSEISQTCRAVELNTPQNFRQALQLVWLAHISFVIEGRYAMALGRLDQYLYPYYRRDIENGVIDKASAEEMLACTFIKIGEHLLLGGDDVVNICIGGVKPDGTGGVNELSTLILHAVGNCNIPGPNLSARIYKSIPDDFLDECLKVIGTGLGYPAMMNDGVNIPALLRHGYSLEDSRNYCMVGCIENFIQGKQPPWSDGRFNVPKYLELALNRGICPQSGVRMGPDTGDAVGFLTMKDFMKAFKRQLSFGASEYCAFFRNSNDRYNKTAYSQPYLSCYCRCCLERGLDINDGGTLYPSVHGACCMGIATVADSLAAIEDIVFNRKMCSVGLLRDALLKNYEGFDDLRKELLKAPKYGNNNAFVDKYAVWYVKTMNELFSKYRTRDGGAIYIAMASNIQNIDAGKEVGATPDGRMSAQPLNDAASPMHGMDKNGPTAVANSVTKPDYTLVSCGSVLNQKYSPSMFSDPEKRAKLLSLIKVYFRKGGQEIQINSVSRKTLTEAMENPENYKSLVVRVSGFSAYYTCLDRSVQQDILQRTEHI